MQQPQNQPQQPQQNNPEPISENKIVQDKKDNVIFIGEKPLINYVRSISVQLSVKKSPEVIIRSRGKFISKAVDVVEVAKRRFFEQEGFKVKDIKIASEEFEKEGRKINVSSMDIIIGK
jgi:DNA-binding protein